MFQREKFATGGGTAAVEKILPAEQAVYDETLGILGNTIKPLATNADSDTGYHDHEEVLVDAEAFLAQLDNLNELMEEAEPEGDVAESTNQSKTETTTAKSVFPTGNKRRRPVLKSSYDELQNITSSKMSQLSRAENNEHELLEIKRKRFKMDENLSKKYEQLVEENMNYVRDKNQREKELFELQMIILRNKGISE